MYNKKQVTKRQRKAVNNEVLLTSPKLACITWLITEGEDTEACCSASDGEMTGCLEKVKHRQAAAFWKSEWQNMNYWNTGHNSECCLLRALHGSEHPQMKIKPRSISPTITLGGTAPTPSPWRTSTIILINITWVAERKQKQLLFSLYVRCNPCLKLARAELPPVSLCGQHLL